MVVEFRLPDLGEGIAEGEIVKWLVSEGQDIKEDQPMVEVMTDKATVQIPSPTSGKVKQILTKEGETVKVGTMLVVIEGLEGETSDSRKASSVALTPILKTTTVQKTTEVSSIAAGRAIATPATRKLARELEVNLEEITGTGPGGRIIEEDVRSLAGKKGSPLAQDVQIPKGAVAPRSQELDSQISKPSKLVILPTEVREERIPLHGIRKRIAEKMSKSMRTAAHVYHVDELDFSELLALREAAKPVAESRQVKLTFLPFIMKALALALKEFPYFNASIDEDKKEIVLKHHFNIGFATDAPNGLVVPVIKGVDKKKVFDIAKEVEFLAEQARNGTISLENIQGGTFTITNIGTLGGIMAMPIINYPEAAILGVSKFQKRPVVRDDQVVIRPMAYITLSFDHRIVDGADAARFTSLLIRYLESPSSLLFEAL